MPTPTSFDAMRLVRIVTGLYYLPHVWSKISGFDGTVAFFAKAGFHPAPAFVVLAGAGELVVGIALILGIFTQYAALASFALMVVAAYAIVTVKGLGWFWAGGGIEYLIFWGLISLAVFADAWQKHPGWQLVRRW